MARDPIPFAKVEEIAKSFRDLRELEARRAGTQAQLIRWCVQAITQTSEEASRTLERQLLADIRAGKKPPHSRVPMVAPARKVRDDRDLGLLYLAKLATDLEHQSFRSPEVNPSEENSDVHGSPRT